MVAPPFAPILRPAVAMLARSPFVPGKTRLTAHMAPGIATALRTALLLDAIEAALVPGWPLHVYVDPATDAEAIAELLERDDTFGDERGRCRLRAQEEGDLGRRMWDAMHRTLSAGHDAVVLTGSDVPDLPADAVREAIAALQSGADDTRIVFGPASDGGFYLVAATTVSESIFEGVEWRTSTVLDAARAQARVAGRDVVLVRPWHDVDTAADLVRLVAGDETTARRTRQVARGLRPYNKAT